VAGWEGQVATGQIENVAPALAIVAAKAVKGGMRAGGVRAGGAVRGRSDVQGRGRQRRGWCQIAAGRIGNVAPALAVVAAMANKGWGESADGEGVVSLIAAA
jgi:hypothetical protein